jgi:hypothetical protein
MQSLNERRNCSIFSMSLLCSAEISTHRKSLISAASLWDCGREGTKYLFRVSPFRFLETRPVSVASWTPSPSSTKSGAAALFCTCPLSIKAMRAARLTSSGAFGHVCTEERCLRHRLSLFSMAAESGPQCLQVNRCLLDLLPSVKWNLKLLAMSGSCGRPPVLRDIGGGEGNFVYIFSISISTRNCVQIF